MGSSSPSRPFDDVSVDELISACRFYASMGSTGLGFARLLGGEEHDDANSRAGYVAHCLEQAETTYRSYVETAASSILDEALPMLYAELADATTRLAAVAGEDAPRVETAIADVAEQVPSVVVASLAQDILELSKPYFRTVGDELVGEGRRLVDDCLHEIAVLRQSALDVAGGVDRRPDPESNLHRIREEMQEWIERADWGAHHFTEKVDLGASIGRDVVLTALTPLRVVGDIEERRILALRALGELDETPRRALDSQRLLVEQIVESVSVLDLALRSLGERWAEARKHVERYEFVLAGYPDDAVDAARVHELVEDARTGRSQCLQGIQHTEALLGLLRQRLDEDSERLEE